MTEFSTFHSTGPVAPASIERFGSAVPEPVVELWRSVGTGLIGPDGFARVIDPAWYADHLATWFDNAEGAVPFLATGMGDLFIWKEPAIRHVLYRTAEIRGIAPEFDSWWGLLEDESYLDVHLERGDYVAAVDRLGVPEVREALYYVPFLPLGGQPGAERLDRGDLSVSLDLFTQLVGRAEL